jgi:hypothetical protein
MKEFDGKEDAQLPMEDSEESKFTSTTSIQTDTYVATLGTITVVFSDENVESTLNSTETSQENGTLSLAITNEEDESALPITISQERLTLQDVAETGTSSEVILDEEDKSTLALTTTSKESETSSEVDDEESSLESSPRSDHIAESQDLPTNGPNSYVIGGSFGALAAVAAGVFFFRRRRSVEVQEEQINEKIMVNPLYEDCKQFDNPLYEETGVDGPDIIEKVYLLFSMLHRLIMIKRADTIGAWWLQTLSTINAK